MLNLFESVSIKNKQIVCSLAVVDVKVTERIFICKKGLTQNGQLGNIRTR